MIELGQEISLAGYITEQNAVASTGKIVGLEIDKIKKPSIAYDANTLPGMSGSRVLLGEYVIGLHCGFHENSNRAIPIYLILKEIRYA